MPLHKSSRAPRLDPTMISAPLGDFRHTMHIGRGGDAFGDTSFLSTHGPSPTSSDLGAPRMVPDGDDSQMPISPTETLTDSLESLPNNELQHYESVSSLTLDLDLGPSILGDVLGVMDGLGLDSEWTNTTGDKVCGTNSSDTTVEKKLGNMMSEEVSLSVQNNLNGKKMSGMEEIWTGDKEEGWITADNGIKSKGSRPKVRFSDKREEIIRQPSEEEEGQAFDFQEGDELACHRPMEGQCERDTYLAGDHKGMLNNSKGDMPPSPTSSHSSEYEEITPLDRRGVDNCHSETDSEEEEAGHSGRGYTFEDEFDDEIGL